MELLIWLYEKLSDIILYPIVLFWEYFKYYRDEGKIGKIILLFVGALSGLFIIGGSLLWLSYYVLSNHFEWVMVAGLILWLFSYVKSKMDKNDTNCNKQEVLTTDFDSEELIRQAMKAYPIMRNIIFQTARADNLSASIGINSPRLLQEIELTGEKYFISNGIVFYQFKLIKSSAITQYTFEDLSVFREEFQSVCSRLITTGNFPTLQIQNYLDAYANLWDAVCIDTLEDIGNQFILTAVFTNENYTDYKHQLQLNQQDSYADMSVPDATWL